MYRDFCRNICLGPSVPTLRTGTGKLITVTRFPSRPEIDGPVGLRLRQKSAGRVTLGHIRSILVKIYYYNVETFKVEKKVIFIYTNLGTFGEYILEKYIFISLIRFNLLILSKLIPGWEKKLRDKYESKFDPTQLIQRIKKNRIK